MYLTLELEAGVGMDIEAEADRISQCEFIGEE